MRALRWIPVIVGVIVATMVVVGVSERGNDPSPSTPPAVVSGYSHEDLQPDADMTRQMSAPNANTESQSHTADPQLERSKDPAYLRALEQHQRDEDRMLARPTP